jgi:hypothetical protein
MAKKLEIVKESAGAASSARSAKPKAPRVKTAQHSKAISAESVTTELPPQSAEPESTDPGSIESRHPHDVIAKIAYKLWEARDGQGGSALEDWVRAEHEYRQLMAATRL